MINLIHKIKLGVQKGRTMVEMLGVLAIIGVLSVGAIYGYRYAMNKHRANQLSYDVSAGMRLLATSKKTGMFNLDFEPITPYNFQAFKFSDENQRVGFVVVEGVEEPICDIMLDMQSDNSFYVYESDESHGHFTPMISCHNVEFMYFSNESRPNGFGCLCQEHAHCVNYYDCECDDNYRLNPSNKKCEPDWCGPQGDPASVTDETCCNLFNYVWENDACRCPDDHEWNAGRNACVSNCGDVPADLNDVENGRCCSEYHLVWSAGECKCARGKVWNSGTRQCDACAKPNALTDVEGSACCKAWGWTWQENACTCPEDDEWDTYEKDCKPACGPAPSNLNSVTRQYCCEKYGLSWNDGKCDCAEGEWDGSECVTCATSPASLSEITTQYCCEQSGYVWKNNACSCPAGNEWDTYEKDCKPECGPTPSDLNNVTRQYCCERYGLSWNEGKCDCAEGEWDGSECVTCGNNAPLSPSAVTNKICCEQFGLTWSNGACTCPDDKPNYSVSNNVGLCCPAGQANVDGVCDIVCYLTNNSNAEPGKGCKTNQDCCSSDDFCAFLNSDANADPEDYSDADAIETIKGLGTCVPTVSYPSKTGIFVDKMMARTDGAANQGMNWWSAQNWCMAQNMEPATRESIGCGSSNTTCNSAYTNEWALDSTWMGSKTDRKLWLEAADASAAWTTRLKKDLNNNSTNSNHNRLARSDDRYALCVKAVTCADSQYYDKTAKECKECGSNPGNPSQVGYQSCCEYFGYTWTSDMSVCSCPDGTMWNDTQAACIEACYTTNNENAPADDVVGCTRNADCCSSSDFCAYLNSDLNSNTKGRGTCTPTDSYPSQSIVIDDALLVRGDGTVDQGMNWWSAQNWCMAKGMSLASRKDIGCDSINKDKGTCNSTYTTAWSADAKWMGEKTDRKLWLRDEASSSVAWTIRLNKTMNNTATGQYSNVFARIQDRYALCYGEVVCPQTQPDDPATITSQECCEYYKNDNNESIWAWDSVNNTCGCPDGGTWLSDQKICMPSNACIYEYQWPSEPYTITHNDNGISWTETKEVSYREVVGCSDPNTYCYAQWKDANCTLLDEIPYNGEVYGQCIPWQTDVRYFTFDCGVKAQ